jgi:hypothetical protein
MNDIDKILLTSALTILGSVIVFVIGQLLSRAIIEPIHDIKKTIGELDFVLIFHAPAIHTPIGKKENEDKAQEALRKIASDLRSKLRVIPVYGFWAVLSCCTLPRRQDVLAAATHLIGLSNSVHKEDRTRNTDIENKIRLLLNLKSYD